MELHRFTLENSSKVTYFYLHQLHKKPLLKYWEIDARPFWWATPFYRTFLEISCLFHSTSNLENERFLQVELEKAKFWKIIKLSKTTITSIFYLLCCYRIIMSNTFLSKIYLKFRVFSFYLKFEKRAFSTIRVEKGSISKDIHVD